jgi:hypothetical protein
MPIGLVAAMAPFRNELVHQFDELVAVSRFQHVDQLVDNDIFKAMFRFLDEFCAEADRLGFGIATAPLRFLAVSGLCQNPICFGRWA